MGVIRSSNKPPEPAPTQVLADGDEDEEFFAWRWEEPELIADELTLPEHPGLSYCYEDEYEHMAYLHRVGWDFDARPAWEHDIEARCSTCNEVDDLDPLGTCWSCRLRDHRCQWCGLDRLVYMTEGSCRTCYQRLRRTSVTSEEALRTSMMEAAFRRSELRKRQEAAT
jgi:hypothetical protein